MKKNKFGIFILTILMSSCSLDFSFDKSSNNSFNSVFSNGGNSSNIASSSSSSFNTTIVTENRTIKMYGINDFHGAVVENVSNYEAGIIKVGSFFKQKGNEENTLLINSGDMWQGSIESNLNYGKLLTECMNNIEFDCFTLGNHEFDWGQKYIKENRQLKDEVTAYQTPFLAANIYKYDIMTGETKEYANLGEKYTIKTLENGLRVGIIGVIGRNQITSITSSFVDDIVFLEPSSVIKELSDELRNEKGVDVVIASVHAEQDDVLNTGITNISDVSHKRYVDAVFCAHSHKNEKAIENGVPFVQASYNGRSYSEISLNVTPAGEVSALDYNYIYTSKINCENDPSLEEKVNAYKEISDNLGNEQLIRSNGTLKKSDSLVNLVTTAMYNEAIKQGYDISYAITNTARADLESGLVTYANLYKSLPFDNEIYIIEVSGSSLKKEINFDSTGMYRGDKEPFNERNTYRIAVIDYLALHRNSKRQYDYFPNFKTIAKLEKSGQEFYNYRDITADYLRSLDGNLNTSNYSSSLDQFNKDRLYYSI